MDTISAGEFAFVIFLFGLFCYALGVRRGQKEAAPLRPDGNVKVACILCSTQFVTSRSGLAEGRSACPICDGPGAELDP